MIWILFYYNSLPQMPPHCSVFSPEVLHRDLLMCNPHNTGHYQYPKFETMSYDEGCHREELRRFLRHTDPEKYVVFYTRRVDLDGTSNNVVVGYFKVGELDLRAGRCGFVSKETVLLPRDHAVPIQYRGRGVPVSWGHSHVRSDVSAILEELRLHPESSMAAKYGTETRSVMSLLTTESGWRRLLDRCGRCRGAPTCPWGTMTDESRKRRLTKLYGDRLQGGCCCPRGGG